MQLSGQLRNRVILLSPTVTDSPLGEQVTEWVKEGEYWAGVTPTPGARDSSTGEVVHTGGIKVRMRYHPRVSERMRLVYDSEVYAVENLYKSRTDDVTTFIATRLPDASPYDYHESELWKEHEEWSPDDNS